jgi:hypothetical protein
MRLRLSREFDQAAGRAALETEAHHDGDPSKWLAAAMFGAVVLIASG